MDRVLLGKHNNSPAIKEVDIISVFPVETAGAVGQGYSLIDVHNPDDLAQIGGNFINTNDIFELPPLSDGSVQRVRVVNPGGLLGGTIYFGEDSGLTPYAHGHQDVLNSGKPYNSFVRCYVTPILIDGSEISVAQSKNELWGKKLKLITYTERKHTTDFGLYVSRPGANVLDPVEAATGNLAFDSSALGTLKVLQRGTFRIQCKKTYMGKKGALELLSDEQNRANADYTKLYPFEVPQQSEEDYLANSPKNANTISLGYDKGQYPQTGNGFNQEFIQNVYCDYGTTTVVFDPPLPDHIKTPHVSLHFAVANSSGHFHPWYANVTCTTGNEDYSWQYANSQHCVHMDSAWFRGKWSFRERTIAPFGTNLNNDFRSIDASSNTNLGAGWSDPDGRGVPTFSPRDVFIDDVIQPVYDSTLNPHISNETSDAPGRPFDRLHGSGDGNAPRYMTENQLGFNLPRFANPTIVPEASNDYPNIHPLGVGSSPPQAGDHSLGSEMGDTSWKPRNRSTASHLGNGADTPKSTAQTLLGLVDPVLFNAEPGDPGIPSGATPSALPREGAVKGTKIESPGMGFIVNNQQTHGRVRPPYYDATTGKPRATSSGEGVAGLHTVRHDDIGPQSYESTLSMNSPYGVWGGAFKSFAGMQGITYFANNTHMKIDAFMTPTHTPTPFETEIVKTREVNPDAAHGDLSKFDWLGASYLGDGTTPNQEFDEFGNIRKNVGLAVDSGQRQPRFKQGLDLYKKYYAMFGSAPPPYPSQFGDLPEFALQGSQYVKDEFADTRSDGLGYSWSNVVHRAANSGYGLPYKEKLPRMFRTKYWDESSPDTEYEWWPINHANGHFTIAYGTKSGGRYLYRANTITAQINHYDGRTHGAWRDIHTDNRPAEYTGAGAVVSALLTAGTGLSAENQENWLDDQEDETQIGSDRSKLEAQFLDESREMGFDDEDLKLYRGHPAYVAACYGDYRPIAFIGSDSDSAGGTRGKNFVLTPYALDFAALVTNRISGGMLGDKADLIYDNTINQLKDATVDLGTPTSFTQRDQEDEWSPFWPLLNKGTRFSNQLPNTEGKGYLPNSQYEPGDAFLKTRTFQGQPTSLDSFWNSFSNNTSQWVSSNTPYGEFYYADGGYAMDVSPYYNYGGQRYIYSAEKVEQRLQETETLLDGGTNAATYRMMKLIPTDFNIQRQSLQKHNWHGGNPKAGVGTEGRRFGFGGAGSAEAIGSEDTFDTYIGTYVVYDLEGGGNS